MPNTPKLLREGREGEKRSVPHQPRGLSHRTHHRPRALAIRGTRFSLSVVLMRHQLFVTLFRRASRRDNAKLTIEQEEVVLDLSESALGASEIYKKLSRKKGVGPLSKTQWINQFFAWLISSPMAHQLTHGCLSFFLWLTILSGGSSMIACVIGCFLCSIGGAVRWQERCQLCTCSQLPTQQEATGQERFLVLHRARLSLPEPWQHRGGGRAADVLTDTSRANG